MIRTRSLRQWPRAVTGFVASVVMMVVFAVQPATADVGMSTRGVLSSVAPADVLPLGFFAVDAGGRVAACSGERWHGSAGSRKLTAPIVSITGTHDGEGYWLLGRDGGIFSFGDARFFGSTGRLRLNRPVVGMASTPSGNGYWLVASDGGIFSFGDARFFGSTGRLRLNRPVVGMASTPSGHGYWLVASDGGIFSFGDARFFGSTGSIPLLQPIVSMTATTSGDGYALVSRDGGTFAFGDAPFFGSAAGQGSMVIGIAPTYLGWGFFMVQSNGQVYYFKEAQVYERVCVGDLALGLRSTPYLVGIASGWTTLRPR